MIKNIEQLIIEQREKLRKILEVFNADIDENVPKDNQHTVTIIRGKKKHLYLFQVPPHVNVLSKLEDARISSRSIFSIIHDLGVMTTHPQSEGAPKLNDDAFQNSQMGRIELLNLWENIWYHYMYPKGYL